MDVLVNMLLDATINFKKDGTPTVADVLPEVIKMLVSQFGEIYTPEGNNNNNGEDLDMEDDNRLLIDLNDLDEEPCCNCYNALTIEDKLTLALEELDAVQMDIAALGLQIKEQAGKSEDILELFQNRVQDAYAIFKSAKNMKQSIEDAKANAKQMKESAEQTLKAAIDYDQLLDEIEQQSNQSFKETIGLYDTASKNALEDFKSKQQIEEEADDEEGGMMSAEMLVKQALSKLGQFDTETLKGAELIAKNALSHFDKSQLDVEVVLDLTGPIVGPIVEKALESLPNFINDIAKFLQA